jgi:hypothetical protein
VGIGRRFVLVASGSVAFARVSVLLVVPRLGWWLMARSRSTVVQENTLEDVPMPTRPDSFLDQDQDAGAAPCLCITRHCKMPGCSCFTTTDNPDRQTTCTSYSDKSRISTPRPTSRARAHAHAHAHATSRSIQRNGNEPRLLAFSPSRPLVPSSVLRLRATKPRSACRGAESLGLRP